MQVSALSNSQVVNTLNEIFLTQQLRKEIVDNVFIATSYDDLL
jgi:hypothetical protein